MEYGVSRVFRKTLQNLKPSDQLEAKRHIDALVRAFEVDVFPVGLGLKKLTDSLWEFRINLSLRILFERHKNQVIFVFVGNHNEVRHFIKNY